MDGATLDDQLTRGSAVEGADLSDIDWQDRAHDDAVFIGCRFVGVSFSGTRLAGGRFTNCHFLRCQFSHADLHEAVFKDYVFVERMADPVGCSFARSDLRGTGLQQSNLSFAAFDRYDLFSVEMDGCNLLGAKFTKVDFTHA